MQRAWKNDQTPPFVAGVLLALLANWALVGGAILAWQFVASGMPRLERTRPKFLLGYTVVQTIHFVAMVVIAFLLSPLLFLTGPPDMGGGALIGLFAAAGPSVPSGFFGFVAPRIFSSRLHPGAFVANGAEAA